MTYFCIKSILIRQTIALNKCLIHLYLVLEVNMSIKVTLGLKIRELRKKQKISQEKFSEMVDLNPRQIVRIENGESFPTAENLEKIAEALNTSVQELFYNDCFSSDDFLRNEITKSLTRLSSKELRMLYLVVSNL